MLKQAVENIYREYKKEISMCEEKPTTYGGRSLNPLPPDVIYAHEIEGFALVLTRFVGEDASAKEVLSKHFADSYGSKKAVKEKIYIVELLDESGASISVVEMPYFVYP